MLAEFGRAHGEQLLAQPLQYLLRAFRGRITRGPGTEPLQPDRRCEDVLAHAARGARAACMRRAARVEGNLLIAEADA